MKVEKTILVSVFAFLLAANMQAQNGLTFIGTVLDSRSGEPIPYSTIIAKNKTNSEAVASAVTATNGTFSLAVNQTNVFIEVAFMGYKTKRIENFSRQGKLVKLGQISLEEDSEVLDEVNITAEKSTVEFKLDKRVFNVGSDISSTGMGALDVLNNVPSVNVDIEGQVSIRGNAGVQILINGKPSVMSDDPAKAMGAITADMIERVEVITNPSAKYDAEGTSGIINIVLKKDDKRGFNGSATVNTGIPNNHSVGLSVNYRTEKFNFFSQLGGGYRSRPFTGNTINQNRTDTTEVRSETDEVKSEGFFNMTIGADYYLNKYNTITLSGNYAHEWEDQPATSDFYIYNADDNVESHYIRNQTMNALNPKWRYEVQYKKEFKNNEEHTLMFSTLGRFFGKEQNASYINDYLLGPDFQANQRTETDYHQADYTFKLDYTNPLSNRFTIESGASYLINDVGNDYRVFTDGTGDWEIDSSLTNDFIYIQKVLGLYGTAAYEGKKWGLKLGLRVENTNLYTELANTNEVNDQNYTNLFPSAHASYKFSKTFSLQAGYSRRIYRPRLWSLNPFVNMQNNFNVRTGNPDLQPEFSDSYEFTSIFLFDKLSLNAGVYYLYTTDVVERVSFYVDSVNLNINQPINLGTNKKVGFELNGKYTATEWLSITADFNYGTFVRTGSYGTQVFDFNGNQWSARGTIKMKLPQQFEVELTPRYESGYKTVQGSVSGYPSLDLGVRKKIWNGKAVINASVRDVFASRIRENIVDEPTYYLYSFGKRGTFFTIGFSYSFGKGEAMAYSGGKRR